MPKKITSVFPFSQLGVCIPPESESIAHMDVGKKRELGAEALRQD
ncbi:MAG: hypothetical protein ABW168_04640 [Sedimenticola sp.]